MEFHHIGVVCKDIEACKESLLKLFPGAEVGETVFDTLQNAHLCMLTLKGGMQVELISGETVMALSRKGITYYHLCFGVPDIAKAIDDLTFGGAMIVSDPKPAALFDKRKVAFLHTPMGLIELLEEDEHSST
jgi:methylmalonyl-CoA/ethylmalonyl-CoA epimerase